MKQLAPNLYVEAVGVVFRKIANDDCEAILESIIKKRSEKAQITEIFKPAIAMMKACEDLILDNQNPLYIPLTSSTKAFQLSPVYELFCCYYDCTQCGSPQQILTKFQADQGIDFVKAILEVDDLEETPVLAVMNSSLTDSDKLNLLKLLFDGQKAIKDFCDLLEMIAERIQPIVDEYSYLYQYLDQLCAKDTCQADLVKRIGIHAQKDTPILPCLCTCNAGFIFGKRGENQDNIMIYIGVLLCAFEFLQPSSFTDEQLIDHLKMFADPTKLSILAILNQAPTYQSDLAKRLSLTTATVSHHMNQLMQNGLVSSELIDKKLYYQYQADMVEHTINELKKYLSKK